MSWVIGVSIYMVGSVSLNFGTNLVKLSLARNALLPENKQRASVMQPLWLVGMAIFLISTVANFAAFAFASQSLLSSVGSIQFVSNLILSRVLHKTKITKLAVVGTCLIIVGNVVIVIFGAKSSATYTVEQLKALYTELAFLVYLLVMSVLVAVVWVLYKLARLAYKRQATSPTNVINTRLVPLAYALVSASIGTFSVLLGKSLSILLLLTLKGSNQLTQLFTYLVLFVFVVISVFWLIRLNASLQKFDAVFIVPTMQVFWILFSVLSGGIYYREFVAFAWYQYLGYAIGMLLLVIGVQLLAPRAPSNAKAAAASKSAAELSDEDLEQQIDDEFRRELADMASMVPPPPMPPGSSPYAILAHAQHDDKSPSSSAAYGEPMWFPLQTYLPHPLVQLEHAQRQRQHEQQLAQQVPDRPPPLPPRAPLNSPYAIFASPAPQVQFSMPHRPLPPVPPARSYVPEVAGAVNVTATASSSTRPRAYTSPLMALPVGIE